MRKLKCLLYMATLALYSYALVGGVDWFSAGWEVAGGLAILLIVVLKTFAGMRPERQAQTDRAAYLALHALRNGPPLSAYQISRVAGVEGGLLSTLRRLEASGHVVCSQSDEPFDKQGHPFKLYVLSPDAYAHIAELLAPPERTSYATTRPRASAV